MLKYAEYTRHSLTEPLLTVTLYKKVEDGKIVGAFRFLYFKNHIIILYEDDSYSGADVISIETASIGKLAENIKKFYDKDTDDLSIIGEKSILDKAIEEIYEDN
ncbi:hypothetical protein [Sulfuracidifex metallicus]|uniref:Uncharacterized protein n=1 Tax=Sulfuracidifex metallicus DSM 6482 = JCM 9184 TaxID=523847 RepID=A0A6A9QK16_SULME|nr:hypothetical protein [Sulfuracidifex metallicus]MUN28439.1 hypothetical protein [Sulfuracidifex metallicus DSM 6482 = JCM 9184]WOE51045.1 hypothetical protein RQ359_000284 [Sulfuracidifex metallicus DSM 6482 = JCM 9184]